MRMQDKVVIVTGASGGIGWRTCERLVEEGAHVVALSRRAPVEGMESGRPHHVEAGEVTFVETDVTDEGSISQAVDFALRRHGRIDGLFANAGVLHRGGTIETSEADWQQTMDVNLTAVWRTARAIAPIMIDGNQGGSIVINSSVNGQRAIAGFAAYTASKFGVIGLAQALAQEVGDAGVRVNTIMPTSTETPMISNPAHRARMGGDAQQEFYRSSHVLPVGWIDPLDVANGALWLLSDESRRVTGICLPIDAGYLVKAYAPVQ